MQYAFLISGFIVLLLSQQAFSATAALTLDGKNVGSITVDKNDPLNVTVNPGNLSAKGVNFLAHFDLTSAFDEQDCCKSSDLRWLQRAKTSKPLPGFTKTDFIDPNAGQNLGGGRTGDGLPFYDQSYSTLNDANNNQNRKANGSGKYAKDQPFNLVSEAPFSFDADLLLVCVHDKQMAILGGVHWGYKLDASGGVTPNAPTALTDTKSLRDALNTDLNKDFPGFSFVSAEQFCIPLPSAAWMILLAVPLLGVARKRLLHSNVV